MTEDITKVYSEAVRDLSRPRSTFTEAQILRCLTARDVVARAIQEGNLTDDRALGVVNLADEKLRGLSERLVAVPQLPRLRASLGVDPTAWWWYPLSSPQSRRLRALSRLAPVAVVALNGITLALLIDTSSRFYFQGFDFIGAVSIIAPALFALAAVDGPLRSALGSAISGLPSLATSDLRSLQLRLLVALAALIIALGGWGSLPRFSTYYSERAVEQAGRGELGAAQQSLERAIRLNPGNSVAYYNLGVVQERLLLWEEATESYRVAVAAGLLPATNNLGHIYLVQGDYTAATQVLIRAQAALNQPDARPEVAVHYALLKNLGWARLGQKRYPEALGLLEQAAALDSKPAAAHCLLGRLYAETGMPEEARDSWQRCRAQARLDEIDDDTWVAEATNYLDNLPDTPSP